MGAWQAFVALLNAIAAVVAPISIIVGLPGGLIGSIVAIVKVRKWAIHSFQPAQAATKAAAEKATTAADRATDAVKKAAKHSEAAQAASVEVEKALIYLAEELGHTRQALAESEQKRDIEAARHDEVFAALLRAKTEPTHTGGLLIPSAAGEDDDPLTATGRHRLHTQHIQTIEGDQP